MDRFLEGGRRETVLIFCGTENLLHQIFFTVENLYINFGYLCY